MTDSLAVALHGVGYPSLALATEGFWGVEVANQVWYPPALVLSLSRAGSCQTAQLPTPVFLTALVPAYWPRLEASCLPPGVSSCPTLVSAGTLDATRLESLPVALVALSSGSLEVAPLQDPSATVSVDPILIRLEAQPVGATVAAVSLGSITVGDS